MSSAGQKQTEGRRSRTMVTSLLCPENLRVEHGAGLGTVAVGGPGLYRTLSGIEVHGGESEGTLKWACGQPHTLGAGVGNHVNGARQQSMVDDEDLPVGSSQFCSPPTWSPKCRSTRRRCQRNGVEFDASEHPEPVTRQM